jgi:hypothetical protein
MEQQLLYPQLGSEIPQIVPKNEDATATIKGRAQLTKKRKNFVQKKIIRQAAT